MTKKEIIDVYEELTGEKLNPEACDKLSIWLAGGDLEAKLSDESDTELIKELATNPANIHHFCAYSSSGGGFHGKRMMGDISRYPYIKKYPNIFFFENSSDEAVKIDNDLQKRYPYANDWYSVWPEHERPEFEARVFGFNLSNGDYMFQMWYNDTTNTDRGFGPHRYILLLPKDNKARIVPKIKKNPELMIKLYRTLFEEFDNSKGEMKLDSNFKHLIDDAEGN